MFAHWWWWWWWWGGGGGEGDICIYMQEWFVELHGMCV